VSKPTFLTLNSSLAFRNGEHLAKDWFATLNGCRVAACEANTERGYVDFYADCGSCISVRRLFGNVELWATSDECNDCKDER
jgi:hypothetical protein